MGSGNPALGADTFRVPRVMTDDAMTVTGAVKTTALALAILLVAASYTRNLGAGDARVPTLTMVGLLGGLVMAIATVVRKPWAAYTTSAYAALNLVLAFDFIEQGAECGVPKFMEWYAAFGLLVTLVWLCLELLRLLAK